MKFGFVSEYWIQFGNVTLDVLGYSDRHVERKMKTILEPRGVVGLRERCGSVEWRWELEPHSQGGVNTLAVCPKVLHSTWEVKSNVDIHRCQYNFFSFPMWKRVRISLLGQFQINCNEITKEVTCLQINYFVNICYKAL